ncbi:MAG: chromate transporter [Clostridia bacterium]|nr:chromate transporter [Clostridia bacterium]
MSIYLLIFLEFFKTGLFAVGGGLATFPFLFAIAEKYGWFSVKQLADMIAVSESTPGPIGINVATYCGFTVSGVFGAIFATLSLVLPSFIVITIIAGLLKNFSKSKTVNNFFYGLRPAVLGLIVVALSGLFNIAL